MNDLEVLFLFYIEEAAAAAFLGLALLGMRPGLKEMLAIGAMQGFAVYLIRNIYSFLKIPLGTHLIFTIFAMVIFIKLTLKAKWGMALSATLIAFISIIISEATMYSIALKFFNVTWERAVQNPSLHIVTAYIGDSILFLLALIVGITRFSLIKR